MHSSSQVSKQLACSSVLFLAAPGTNQRGSVNHLKPSAAAAAAAVAHDGDADEDDELYEDLPQSGAIAAAAADANGVTSGADVSSDGEDDVDADLAVKDPVVLDEGLTDMDYLRARMKKNLDDVDVHADDVHADVASDLATSDNEDNDMVRNDIDELNATLRGDQTGVSPSYLHSSAMGGKPVKHQGSAKGQDNGLRPGQAVTQDAAEHMTGNEGDKTNEGGTADEDKIPTFSGLAPGDEEQQQGGAEAQIQATGRLFVRNLCYGASEADLSEFFGGYGNLEEVHLVLDR